MKNKTTSAYWGSYPVIWAGGWSRMAIL